jgi:hypothetical protein
MKWVPDRTGRFERRPYYEHDELDGECERLIAEFLIEFYGQMPVPIPTGALLKLIERDARRPGPVRRPERRRRRGGRGDVFLYDGQIKGANPASADRAEASCASPAQYLGSRIRACVASFGSLAGRKPVNRASMPW